MSKAPAQLALFAPPPRVPPAEVDDATRALAAAVPPRIALGTSSWSFPGWRGLVYRGDHPEQRLAQEGLQAYAAHPLLRAVGVDRTFYAPVRAEVLRGYADAVPQNFRFLVKAHDACVLARFPRHPRYGAQAGEPNPRFLAPAYARDAVVAPFVEGLGGKGFVLLFQFPPQELGEPQAFTDRVQRFLEALPKGVPYALEPRSPKVLGPAWAAMLRATGASHGYALHPELPALDEQLRRIDPVAQPRLVVRWMLRADRAYEAAKSAYEPFDRLVEEDPPRRRAIAQLLARSTQDAIVIVNNKAEGSAPRSLEALAKLLEGGGA